MSGESIRVRPLSFQEAELAAALEKACFPDPWSRESLEEGMKAERLHLLLAEQDQRPAGYCAAQLVLDEGELLRIGVVETCRRQGIGRLLLKSLLERFPQITAWHLEVREGNQPAVALYRQMGFLPSGVRKRYYRDPVEDALLMYKKED